MSTEKPRKRLVGWMQYLMTIADKGVFYSFAGAFLCGGAVVMLVATCMVIGSIVSLFQGDLIGILEMLIGVCVGCLGLGAIRIANNWIKEAKQIAPVALLTQSAAKQLPEFETLVRSSDSPAGDLQDELLRAARQAPETPPEQLLRATQENRQKE